MSCDSVVVFDHEEVKCTVTFLLTLVRRQEIKGYKFNGEDPGAAAFIREQEDLRSAHSTWFAEKSTVLAEHHVKWGTLLTFSLVLYRSNLSAW